MPVHDWTRVDDGVFHDVHGAWIAELRKALNGGLLPADFFAMSEQSVGGGNPDVLTLEVPSPGGRVAGSDSTPGGVALLTAPPRTKVVVQSERASYTAKQRKLVIRHRSGQRVVAVIEIVSAGNKAGAYPWQQFVDKSLAALYRGIHLLIVDLHPPGPRDPNGVHGAIWGALTGEDYALPAEANRTLVAYSAGPLKTAYAEPVAVGQSMPDMPLFLTPDGESHVLVPVEATYMAAYSPLGRYYRDILEAPAAS